MVWRMAGRRCSIQDIRWESVEGLKGTTRPSQAVRMKRGKVAVKWCVFLLAQKRGESCRKFSKRMVVFDQCVKYAKKQKLDWPW